MTALVIAHGHPRFSKGGAEIAAYRIYQALLNSEGWENSAFLAACTDDAKLKPGCEIYGLSDSEWLIRRSIDPFLHDTNINLTKTAHGFLYSAINHLNPTVVHLHHYIHIGLDLIHALKRWFPQAKFIFTLHEYYGICPYEGRLLRRNGSFCDGPEPDECLSCVGDEKLVKLAVRRSRIDHFFTSIDKFISPSYFLKQRYVDWGIEADRITVIENLPLPNDYVSSAPLCITDRDKSDEDHLVFAYFGQMNRWKGIDIILEAFFVAIQKCPNIRLEIHGVPLDVLSGDEDFQDQVFLSTCRRLIKKLPSGSVRLLGTYEPKELPSRLQSPDVVVMASRWYENAPMVIQESFSQGVPVIAPNYGGMAEKIDHKVTGFLCNSFGVHTLSSSFLWMAQHLELLSDMSRSVKENSLSYDLVLQEHMVLYKG